MNVSEKTLLAALCTVAAILSGTTVTLLTTVDSQPLVADAPIIIRTHSVQTSSISIPRPQPGGAMMGSDLGTNEPLQDRFGFVSDHASPLLSAALSATIATGEDWTAWTSETTVAAPPSIVRLPRDEDDALALGNASPQRGRPYSLSERLREIGPSAQQRLHAKFVAAKAPWRPAELALIAVKDEKVLELHARPAGGSWTFIHRYPVLAASGGNGPKLRRGDKQVPEGVYGITFLNPNSRFHVALRVNYPNAFDRRMGLRDGRKDLGGDIMIHGKAQSVGCLAIGDEAAEELFVLAAETGLKNIKLVIAPTDLRKNAIPGREVEQPSWLPDLYQEIAAAMAPYKAPPTGGLLSLFSTF